jgi:hypothetical protein
MMHKPAMLDKLTEGIKSFGTGLDKTIDKFKDNLVLKDTKSIVVQSKQFEADTTQRRRRANDAAANEQDLLQVLQLLDPGYAAHDFDPVRYELKKLPEDAQQDDIDCLVEKLSSSVEVRGAPAWMHAASRTRAACGREREQPRARAAARGPRITAFAAPRSARAAVRKPGAPGMLAREPTPPAPARPDRQQDAHATRGAQPRQADRRHHGGGQRGGRPEGLLCGVPRRQEHRQRLVRGPGAQHPGGPRLAASQVPPTARGLAPRRRRPQAARPAAPLGRLPHHARSSRPGAVGAGGRGGGGGSASAGAAGRCHACAEACQAEGRRSRGRRCRRASPQVAKQTRKKQGYMEMLDICLKLKQGKDLQKLLK